ncbi:MAG: hypothetical protein HQL31_08640 [Planctomycetes bacterium]|nr:hypothetical protein [Planctomycetota bacterium]
MKKVDQLDDEEREIEEHLEKVFDAGLDQDALDKRKVQLSLMARQSSPKVMRVNIRFSEKDLANLRARASREGLAYQTLVSSIVHRYLEGDLVEADSFARGLLAAQSSRRSG